MIGPGYVPTLKIKKIADGIYSVDYRRKGPLRIGDFSLHAMKDGKIWIEHKSGEGMATPSVDLAKVIQEYYKENF